MKGCLDIVDEQSGEFGWIADKYNTLLMLQIKFVFIVTFSLPVHHKWLGVIRWILYAVYWYKHAWITASRELTMRRQQLK